MAGRKNTYQHFCPAARALEVIGEKWSLLIVRDLLAGPRRFNELRRSLTAVTPRWLSLRLRELEEAGIVERKPAGAREVWYHLTPKGRDLAPVLTGLMVWGIEHALRPPAPDEAIHPGRATDGFVSYLNYRGVRLEQPVTWVVRFTDEHAYPITIRFEGERWSRRRGEEPADVVVETSLQAWAAFLLAGPDERRDWLAEATTEGTPERIEELARTLGRPEPGSHAVAGPIPMGDRQTDTGRPSVRTTSR